MLVLLFSTLFAVSVYARSIQLPLLSQHTSGYGHATQADWDDLNRTVGYKLHRDIPVAAPCYPSEGGHGSRDRQACEEVFKNRENNIFISEQPGGHYFSNWASCQATGETCAIPLAKNGSVSASAQCHQGSLPDYYIEVKDESDVISGLEFARKHNIPVVVKNSGHDWKGRSTAPGGLALWTHHLRKQMVLDENFVPKNSSKSVGAVITFGAGEKWSGIYQFAKEKNKMVMGGTCGDVGPAGWISGGGHSPLSPAYGLGVDNLQQVRIVLPNGTFTTSSRDYFPDIFFAVTGGGPNTYGVLIEMSYSVHEITPIQEYTLNYPGLDSANARELFDILTKNAADWQDKGWGGYINTNRRERFLALVNPISSPEDAQRDMKPLTDFAEKLSPDVNQTIINTTWPSWDAYFQQYYAPVDYHKASWSASVASRLVPSSMFKNETERASLSSELLELHYTYNLNLILMLVAPSYRHQTVVPYSLHPAWRTSTWLIRVNFLWDQYYQATTPRTNREVFMATHEAMNPLRSLIPSKNTGVSMSEADIWEPDHQEVFWGSNKDKLQRIKTELDPLSTLVVYQGVGSELAPKERWRCYPENKAALIG